jgi:diguanylate cyclase (GGDEF)-like protein
LQDFRRCADKRSVEANFQVKGVGTDPSAPTEDDRASRERAERDALLRVAAAAAGALDLESVLELAAEEARRGIGASSLTISRFEDDRTRYRTLLNVGELSEWELHRPEDEIYAVADFPRLVALAETGKPYFDSVDDPESDPAAAEFLRRVGKTSDLGVAIVVEGEIWGGLWATTVGERTIFRAEDVRFLEAIAGQLAAAIGRAELFSRVSRLAYEDTLTGLANRRALDERLERALARYIAGEATVALLLCDLDGLKGINDLQGHLAGDDALRQVANALVAAAAEHPGAFVARLGGDEFCVLLESRELPDAHDELRGIEELGTSAQRLLNTGPGLVTISCGAATATKRTATAATLMRAADTAQYVAKRRGGNRLCTAAQVAESPDRLPQLLSEGSVASRIATATETIAVGLAGDLAGADVLERLEFVCASFTEAADLARWAIGIAASGTGYLRDLSLGDNRSLRGAGARIASSNQAYELYELDDYPETARVVGAGTGSFIARVGEEGTDLAEQRLLKREGNCGVVAAVAAGEDGAYLVELFTDETSAPLEAIEPLLALSVQAAMPVVPHQRTADPGGSANSRALELSLALAHRLAGATAEHEVTEASVEEVQSAFGCAVVHLVGITGDRFEVRAERGPNQTAPGWTQRLDVGLIGRCLQEDGPVLAVDVTREPQFRSTKATKDVRSELAVPVMVSGKPWGVINLEDTKVGAFNLDDARLLESVAAQIGGALAAIGLYQQLDRAYVGTAEALSAALEAKDHYTAAHSQSIAENAVAVGQRLGMDAEEQRMLRYAAAFHDIGKLAIPREMLNKPGPLTDAEWAEMSQHTLIGERILRPIEFLAPIRPIVRHAHERWDGNGYPDGLLDTGIPLGARILFACDAYDAMTTDRSYRAAMSVEAAMDELRRCSGTQFDPTVVTVLLEVLEEGLATTDS